MRHLLCFLTQREKILAQALNHFVYNIALSRVQTRMPMLVNIYYFKQPNGFTRLYNLEGHRHRQSEIKIFADW